MQQFVIERARSNEPCRTQGALGYGAGASLVAGKLKISKAAAEAIYEGYHELYKEIDEYNARELEFALKNGYVISDISGLRLWTPDVNSLDGKTKSKAERVIGNFKIQSSAVLTVRAIVRVQKWIEDNNLQNRIKIINTIHDAIYAEIEDDVELILAYNKVLIEAMCAPYKDNMPIQLESALDIGYDWAHLHTIPNDATKDDVLKALGKI